MKELYVEGVATRNDPESCGHPREVMTEALKGASMGAAIEPRKKLPDADPVLVAGRPPGAHRHREMRTGPAGVISWLTKSAYRHGEAK